MNADGVNEVIGYVDAPYYWSRDGRSLKILKKVYCEYKNISMVNTAPHLGVYIFDTRTCGFYDLKLFPGIDYSPMIVKYNQKQRYYEYFFPN